jgi:hypothetical protein
MGNQIAQKLVIGWVTVFDATLASSLALLTVGLESDPTFLDINSVFEVAGVFLTIRVGLKGWVKPVLASMEEQR